MSLAGCRLPGSSLFAPYPRTLLPCKPANCAGSILARNIPSFVGIQPGRCTVDGNELVARPLSDAQRVRWWCPMHPAVTADHQGERCEECGGMMLKPRVLSYQPPGKVLTVPESAVIDTGSRTVVFIETMPGMFDGVEVDSRPAMWRLLSRRQRRGGGPEGGRRGGLLAGCRDAPQPEPRIQLFRGGRPISVLVPFSSVKVAGSAEGRSPLARLDRADRLLAERQKICPVTRKALGSMGAPTRVAVAGRVVFLCCGGCKDALEAEPARYLAVLPAQPSP